VSGGVRDEDGHVRVADRLDSVKIAADEVARPVDGLSREPLDGGHAGRQKSPLDALRALEILFDGSGLISQQAICLLEARHVPAKRGVGGLELAAEALPLGLDRFCVSALRTEVSTASIDTRGLVTKSKAPRWSAFTALSNESTPDRMSQAGWGQCSLAHSSKPKPSRRGISTSVITTSTVRCSRIACASTPSPASSTSYVSLAWSA
jgi:hypothetical protein